MIRSNWKKSLFVTTALAVAACVPAMTLARTAYPAVTPPADVMSDTQLARIPVKTASKHKSLKHKTGTSMKASKKSSSYSRHTSSRKHKKTTAKTFKAV